jgi:MATE family multidrug resistance protein
MNIALDGAGPRSTLASEAVALGRLALPIVLTQLTMMSLGVVDLWMVGRVDEAAVQAVAAVALGNVWKIGTAMVAMGLILGIDPFVSQAHGAHDQVGLARAFQRGLVIALAASVPVAVAWLYTGEVLLAFGQDPAIVAVAHRYLLVQVPSIPCFLVFAAQRQYLQGRGILLPTLWVALAANLLNAGLNWVLIYGHLGFPALGAVGSGVTTGVVQLLLPLMMYALMRAGSLQEGAWVPWSRAAVDPRALGAVLKIGVPVGLHLGAEIWGFQIVALWAGWLGRSELAANTIVLNMASLSFMVPLGIGLAAVTRVGNLVGAGRERDAQTASWSALALGAAVMASFALAFVGLRDVLPRLYLDPGASPEAARTFAFATAILPIAAAFQLFDGTQVVAAGVLRGMGTVKPTALANLAGYYAIGLPLGWWLTFRRGAGLPGLWWGLAAGLAVVALSLLAWIAFRGPARRARRVALA